MTTVANLIDRTLRDWLEGSEDQPVRAVLVGTIDEDATELTYDPTLLAPEELELMGPGSLIEIGSEEIIVGDIDEDGNTLSELKRAANGTLAEAHVDGAFLYPNRLWRRRVIFDAMGDAIVSLYPDLYRVLTSEEISLTSRSYTEVPLAIADDIVGVRYFLGTRSGQSSFDNYPVRLLTPFPPSSTGKAIVVDGPLSGSSGYLIYKAKFARPSAETDELDADLGIEPDWEQIVILDVVAYLLAARELDVATQERLSRQLEQQGYPAGTPSQIRDQLLRYRQVKLQRAKDSLRAQHGATVVTSGFAG